MKAPSRTGAKWVGGIALLLVTLAGAPLRGSAQEEIFERGNELYQSGEYEAAIEAYEAIREAGFASPDLHYNLGNAHFKLGDLGPAILEWERARVGAPGDPDIAANLELARTLTADAVEPLPRFWLFTALEWSVNLIPRGTLLLFVALGWVALFGGLTVRVLARSERQRSWGRWVALVGIVGTVLLGTNLIVRELRIGQPDRGVILADTAPVRSAPADDDNLTLFEVHEGTVVRIDQRAGEWAEVVLADGKVGWVLAEAMDEI